MVPQLSHGGANRNGQHPLKLIFDMFITQIIDHDRTLYDYTFVGPAPAISRLGINPYQWGTECLSGDVNAGPATSFPQSIGMVQ